MVAEDETRRSTESGESDFDGRDLLMGRPEGAAARTPATRTEKTPPPAPSLQSDARDDPIREILKTVQATVARIDGLHVTPGPEHNTAEALVREAAALNQAVADARGAFAKAAELAARRDAAAEAAQALAGAAACASKARLNDEPVLCSIVIDPLPEITVPYYPDVILTERSVQRSSEPSAEQ